MTLHRLDILDALATTVETRKGASPESSYTAKLLSKGIEKCAKLGEEAVELALASMTANKSHVASEAADLLYHLLVLLMAADVPLSDVMAELGRRQERADWQKRLRARRIE